MSIYGEFKIIKLIYEFFCFLSIKNINCKATINVKVTIQQYKKFLKTSLEKIVSEFGLHTEKWNTEIKYDNNSMKIKVIIMTKKTGDNSLFKFVRVFNVKCIFLVIFAKMNTEKIFF